MARSEIVGIEVCGMCGRSSGHLRAGAMVCAKCRNLDAPTQAHEAFLNIGFSTAEVAELAGVSVITLKRALRGDPVSARSAAKLSAILEVPIAVLRAGEPDPFRE